MESVNITYAGSGKTYQNLSVIDKPLITSNYINSVFGNPSDYVELFIYDESGNIIDKDYDGSDYYPYLTANPKNNTYSSLVLDPEKDLRNRGFNRGNLNIQYGFYRKLFNSQFGTFYWIKEISTSRTELKLASQVLSDSLIQQGFSSYQTYVSSKNYYPVFYLNFGNNQLVIATNVAYTQDDQGGYLLVKLYEPLPTDFSVKSQLWIVDKIADSVSFDVSIQVEATNVNELFRLRGPNYSVNLNTKNGQTTPYYNYNNLIANPVTSSFQKMSSYYQDSGVQINVDYSDFNNFVKLSSAVQRINNFVYKLEQIEEANLNIALQQSVVSGSSTYVNSSISVEQQTIDNIIKNFDTYEYFLYFESSSWAWPKRTSTQPYQLYSVTSSQASNFLGDVNVIPSATTQSLLWSASYYDSTNKDLFHNSIPQYLLDDPSNQPYITFLDMVGQHFDNIWIYYKDVTNRFNATNNPDTGISLDLVSDALKGLGMQLYTNTNVSDNLYYTLFGINPDGSLLPPTGSEKITNYVTSSISTLPAQTIQDEIYKRLYHNLPYLYKVKGTSRGIKSLVSIYGIPESILSVREFGGNFTGSLDGIIDLNSSEYKVNIITGSGGNVTGSLTISSSLLSPYTTIQYFSGDTRLNNTNVEVGFSPANVINENIVSSQGIFDMNQLVGSPGYMYSASYQPLVSASNAYFSSYNKPNSIWEYIRLLKFYNNSLFKLIKDFAPARANVSTGIIVKSHMLERNKYARHEPQFTFNNHSQSIDILEISAGAGGSITGSSAWSSLVVTPLGLAAYSSSQNQELFTGEFSGSLIGVTDGLAFQQGDYVSHVTGAVETYNYGAIYQNVTASVKSQFQIDLDYTANQLKPVNYGAVTYSISQSSVNAYATYTNQSNPFAEIQDFNQNYRGFLNSRYKGQQLQSATYNTYTNGDLSYGKTAVIDKIKYQYGYIGNIYSSSLQMPYRAQAQLKYIINDTENVINLSKNNDNWFTVQNVFKSGEWADVSLFTYDLRNPYIQKLNNEDNDFTVWESGYSYSPIIYNPSGALTYVFDTPITTVSAGSSTSYTTINSSQANYWTFTNVKVLRPGGNGNYTPVIVTFTASVVSSPSTKDVLINLTLDNTANGGSPSTYTNNITIAKGNTTGYISSVLVNSAASPGNYVNWLDGQTVSLIINSEQEVNSGTTSVTSYVNNVTETNAKWYVTDQQNQIIISATQSLYYPNFTATGSYAGLDAFVFPFEISPYDMIRLYNYSSSKWDQSGEFRVKSVTSYNTQSINYVALNLDRSVDSVFTVGTTYPLPIEKYMVLKRLKDETSIYFNYNLPITITEEGTLFPQYIGQGVKEKSGNVIKSLKQQNLI